MASIPLVALAANTQQPSPLDQYSKAVQLKGLLQQQQQQAALAPGQQQLQQQAIQGGQQEQQMRDIQLKDAQAGMKAMQAWDGKDPNELPDLIRQNGGSLNAVMGAKAAVVKQQTDYANMNLAQLNAGKQKSDYLLGKLQAATGTDVPDAQLGSSILQAAQESVRDGYLDPQHAQQLQQMVQQSPNPADLRSKLSIYEKSLMGQSEQLAQTNKQKELENATITANAAKTRAENTSPSAEGIALRASQGDPAAIAAQKNILQQSAAKAAADETARIPAQVSAEVQKAQALAPSLDSATKTMMSGQKYLDLTNLKGPEAALLTRQAMAAGIPVADAKTSTALSAIDTARKNQQFMLDQVSAKLASGAPGRLWYGPANTIERIAQSDPTMGAIGDYRSAAIQSMRAVAGSGGLRINQAEIKQATDNDIPKLTDTLPVAQQKLKNMEEFLNNTEKGMLQQNRASGQSATPKANASGQVQVTDPRGVVHTFPDQKSADAFKAAAGIH